MSGRFAPSPTSALHLGNFRTAVCAFLLAVRTGRRFVLRVEDLDQQRVAAAPGIAQAQLADLAALGLVWDECVWQSQRLELYADALATLRPQLYECFCTRREIAESAQAPHGDGFRPYGGTCLTRSTAELARLRLQRPAALRLRSDAVAVTVTDRFAGSVSAVVDDFVVQRGDGVFAYNLAVVVDDVAQGVTQVVRGDDLLSSSPRQAYLTGLLGGVVPEYAHIPLVYAVDGRRLAKRDHDVTLAELGVGRTLSLIGESLDICEPGEPITLADIVDRVPLATWTPQPWTWKSQIPQGVETGQETS